MSTSTFYAFDDGDGFHTIGINDPEQAYEFMEAHAAAHGLQMPETDVRDIRFRACVNERIVGDTVQYDRVPEGPNARRLFSLDLH